MERHNVSRRQRRLQTLRAAVSAALIAGTPQGAMAKSPDGLRSSIEGQVYTVSPETLDRAIRDIERGLAPGGNLARVLDDPNSTLEDVDRVLRFVGQAIQLLELMRSIPEAFTGQNEAVTRAVPPMKNFYGAGPRLFTSINAVGESQEHLCHGYYVAYGGSSFFATAQHCIVGTTKEGDFIKFGSNDEDVAVQFLPDYQGPAMTLDPLLDDAEAQGKLTLVQGRKHGKEVRRLGFLIKMSSALYKKIFPQSATVPQNQHTKSIASQFMILTQPGDATLDARGDTTLSGLSGSMVSVWARGGYRAIGPFFAVRVEKSPGESGQGINSPMGFIVGIDALKEAFEKARKSGSSASGWVARVKGN